VAEFVDRKIREVMQANVHEPAKAAILAALQITDELFSARSASRELEAGIRDLGAEVRRWLPPAKRGEGAA
jgi:cell division protein ZapA